MFDESICESVTVRVSYLFVATLKTVEEQGSSIQEVRLCSSTPGEVIQVQVCAVF